jgi:hypothetical protein
MSRYVRNWPPYIEPGYKLVLSRPVLPPWVEKNSSSPSPPQGDAIIQKEFKKNSPK